MIELLGDLDNSRLEVSGSLKAEAKENGDGGFIETSAADVKIQETAQISTQAKMVKQVFGWLTHKILLYLMEQTNTQRLVLVQKL